MTAWRHDAECATAGLPTDVWFDPGHERMAVAICADCPVRQACLDAALVEEAGVGLHGRHGIRGGQTPAERAAGHGSRAGYKRGCRCDDCREANALASRKTRAKQAAGGDA